jgi:anthranilate phosphoribosyltransferase
MIHNQPQAKTGFTEIITKLSIGRNLSAFEAEYAAKIIFDSLTNNQPDTLSLLSTYFGGLTKKKPTVDELVGMVKAMDATRTFAFQFNNDAPLVTAGGTGGDTFPTINVTTPAVIIAAAAGAHAIKSGSKSFSSKMGCIDLAEELGINVYATQTVVEDCMRSIGISVWASQGVYPWMRPLIELSAEAAAASAMPMLYSLRLMIAAGLNPFSLKRQVRGVSQPFTETIAAVLAKSGYERALVVLGYGANEDTRIDEFSNLGRNVVSEVKADGSVVTYDFYPEDIGLQRGDAREVVYPGSHESNAQTVVNVLSGIDRSARRDLVLLNASAILYVAGKAADLKDGYDLAMQVVDDGCAVIKLRQLISLSGGQTVRLESFLNSTVKGVQNGQ